MIRSREQWLEGHLSLTQENDLIIIGGYSETGYSHYSSLLYKFKCKNGSFEWSEMRVQLKIPRSEFVASLIPG